MRAFTVDRHGKTGNDLRAADVPEPVVRDNDVLVRIHAVGVNVLDARIRDGEFSWSCPTACRWSWATT
jgi:NADPH:quinone reductase-like Zn-dependent oxidoreductase